MADDDHLIERATGDSQLLHSGFLELRVDTVLLPDGSRATREYLRHNGAVAVVPLLDDGRLVLVRQYRYPLARVLLEFPAGKLEVGEEQLPCARRELQEETGYVAREWAFGGEIHNAAAYSSESIWIWFARGLVPGPARLDPGEFVETVTLTVAELVDLSGRGELTDVKTQIALCWLQSWQAGVRTLNWQPLPAAASL
ncbi:MAG: ADP-ribose pyrophosphatase [Leptothrix sp. (in: Bacteria)]|nr:ADP-ribose pyrophosphatase [Leptothrix sp. (in: b-proteobacteria)]